MRLALKTEDKSDAKIRIIVELCSSGSNQAFIYRLIKRNLNYAVLLTNYSIIELMINVPQIQVFIASVNKNTSGHKRVVFSIGHVSARYRLWNLFIDSVQPKTLALFL